MAGVEHADDALPSVPWSFLSERTARNPIRSCVLKTKALCDAGRDMLVMAGGRPTVDTFPIHSVTVRGSGLAPASGSGGSEGGSAADGAGVGEVAVAIRTDDHLNYGPTMSFGLPALREWCASLTRRLHSPPARAQHATIVTPGNTQGIMLCLSMLSDPGDVVLCAEHAYSGVFASARPLDRRVVGVAADADGMLPDALDLACTAMTDPDTLRGDGAGAGAVGTGGGGARAGAQRPRLVYLIPTGSNPTGATMPEGRRRAIYATCCKHNLWIVEDDPYAWLTMGGPGASGPEDMLGSTLAAPSFLSMDAEGRVVRLDSFSKVLAPAARVGWMTARKEFVDKAAQCSEVLVWALSGVSQAVVLAVLEGWGDAGLDRHLRSLQWEYTRRRDRLCAALAKHLGGSRLARWELPAAGMFVWIDVGPAGVSDGFDIVDELLDAGVSMVPGGAFSASGAPCSCFRASFTLVTDDDAVDRGVARLAGALKALRDRPRARPVRGSVGEALAGALCAAGADVDRKRREAAALEARLAALREEIASLEER